MTRLASSANAKRDFSNRLGDLVYEFILAGILSGRFPVSRRLPAESDIAHQVAVSRPTVREALGRLRDEGLVASRRGSGSYVLRRPAPELDSFAPLSSIADIQRCFVFRIAVEGETAAMAARVRHPDGLSCLQHASHALRIVGDRGQLGVEEDLAFHRAIAQATANRFFTGMVSGLQEQMRAGIQLNRQLSLIQSKARLEAVHAEHDAIVHAILDGNEQAARGAMHSHLDSARKRVFEGD